MKTITSLTIDRRTGLLVTVAAVAYAALCGALLTQNPYMGAAGALAPGVAAGLLHARARASSGVWTALAWVFVIMAALPWQTLAVTATGAVDAGSQANSLKFAITGLACAIAFLTRVERRPYPWHVKALLVYALISAIGGLGAADASSSLLRAVRLAAIALAVVWLAGRMDRRRMAEVFTQSTAVVSLVALVARAADLESGRAFGGRLAGYLPPLHPNELGLMAGAGLLCAIALLARGELARGAFLSSAPVLAITLLLTQSRTAMVAVVVGLLVLAGYRLTTRGPLIVGALALAFLLAGLVQTNTGYRPLDALVTHNGSTTATGTLGSRAAEWNAVVHLNNRPVQVLAGQGLAAKSVAVELASARYAPVDGSWPAAYLSAGLAGVAALAAAVLAVLGGALRRRDDFAMALVAFLIVNSLVADVFNDVTVGLVLLLSLAARDRAPAPD